MKIKRENIPGALYVYAAFSPLIFEQNVDESWSPEWNTKSLSPLLSAWRHQCDGADIYRLGKSLNSSLTIRMLKHGIW